MKGSATLALFMCLVLCGCSSPLAVGGNYYPASGGPSAIAGVLGSVAIAGMANSTQSLFLLGFLGFLILVFVISNRNSNK